MSGDALFVLLWPWAFAWHVYEAAKLFDNQPLADDVPLRRVIWREHGLGILGSGLVLLVILATVWAT